MQLGFYYRIQLKDNLLHHHQHTHLASSLIKSEQIVYIILSIANTLVFGLFYFGGFDCFSKFWYSFVLDILLLKVSVTSVTFCLPIRVAFLVMETWME